MKLSIISKTNIFEAIILYSAINLLPEILHALITQGVQNKGSQLEYLDSNLVNFLAHILCSPRQTLCSARYYFVHIENKN